MIPTSDKELNIMQSAKGTGTMPCILILPPGDANDSKADPKSQSQEKQSVRDDIKTGFSKRHASCDSHIQTRDNETKDEETR